LKGKGARIMANNPPQARRYQLEHAIFESHLAGKGGRFGVTSAQYDLEIVVSFRKKLWPCAGFVKCKTHDSPYLQAQIRYSSMRQAEAAKLIGLAISQKHRI